MTHVRSVPDSAAAMMTHVQAVALVLGHRQIAALGLMLPRTLLGWMQPA